MLALTGDLCHPARLRGAFWGVPPGAAGGQRCTPLHGCPPLPNDQCVKASPLPRGRNSPFLAARACKSQPRKWGMGGAGRCSPSRPRRAPPTSRSSSSSPPPTLATASKMSSSCYRRSTTGEPGPGDPVAGELPVASRKPGWGVPLSSQGSGGATKRVSSSRSSSAT